MTELLVVISIIMILMAIMASALGAFTHTSRVDVAADTLAMAFREARYYALSNNVSVVPVILRDTEGRFTVTYAAKALSFNGTLAAATPSQTWAPTGAVMPWSLTRQSLDGVSLEKGAFIYMIGAPTLNLTDTTLVQAYPEVMYMKVTPPADPAMINDSSQYTYELIARGVHNTILSTYDYITTNYGGATGFAVVTGTNIQETFASDTEAREYTVSGASLPEHIVVDQVPKADGPNAGDRVVATVTAQAAIFQESGMFAATDGGKYPPTNAYPVFMPIFQPDGSVSAGASRSALGGLEANRLAHPSFQYIDQTIRVLDAVTREARYVTVASANGLITVGTKLPARYGAPTDPSDPNYKDPGIPPYEEVNDPTSTTASSSTSASTATGSNTTTTASNTTSTANSSTSSTGTASNTSTNSTSNSSTNSNSTSNSTSASSNTSTASSTGNSTSNSTASSTGTASTSASSTNSSSSSNSTSGGSTTASTTAGGSTTTSNTASTTSSTSGAPSSSGVTSSSGGTSSGDGVFNVRRSIPGGP